MSIKKRMNITVVYHYNQIRCRNFKKNLKSTLLSYSATWMYLKHNVSCWAKDTRYKKAHNMIPFTYISTSKTNLCWYLWESGCPWVCGVAIDWEELQGNFLEWWQCSRPWQELCVLAYVNYTSIKYKYALSKYKI